MLYLFKEYFGISYSKYETEAPSSKNSDLENYCLLQSSSATCMRLLCIFNPAHFTSDTTSLPHTVHTLKYKRDY